MTGLALPFKLSFQWLLNTFWKGLQSDVLPTPNTPLYFIHTLFIFDSSATWQAAWLSSNQIQNLFTAYVNKISMGFECLDIIGYTSRHLKCMQISFKQDINSFLIKSYSIWFKCILVAVPNHFRSKYEWNLNSFWMWIEWTTNV